MKKFKPSLTALIIASMSLILSHACSAQSADGKLELSSSDKQQALLTQEAKQRVQRFATALKGALVSAIQAHGLTHAVKVCKEQAPGIAKDLSVDGWEVRRTSLQTRNAKNKPDAWEVTQLRAFDKAFKSGAVADSLVATQVIDGGYRFMKAIPTQQVCLACHGTQVDPKLLQVIQENYPQDKATGYSTEDIRGAFTLSKSIATN